MKITAPVKLSLYEHLPSLALIAVELLLNFEDLDYWPASCLHTLPLL